jgi:hypothetical protein
VLTSDAAVVAHDSLDEIDAPGIMQDWK